MLEIPVSGTKVHIYEGEIRGAVSESKVILIFSKYILLNENYCILSVIQYWLRLWQPSKEVTSLYLNQWWLTSLSHKHVTRPQWVIGLVEIHAHQCSTINFVLPSTVPPKFDSATPYSVNLTVIVTRPVVIDCPAFGVPPPEIIWYKDGYEVYPDSDENLRIMAGKCNYGLILGMRPFLRKQLIWLGSLWFEFKLLPVHRYICYIEILTWCRTIVTN